MKVTQLRAPLVQPPITGIMGSSISTAPTAIAAQDHFSQRVMRRTITIAASIAAQAIMKNIAWLRAVSALVMSSSVTMPIEQSKSVISSSGRSACHTRSTSIESVSVPSGKAAASISACGSAGWVLSAISTNALIWNSISKYVSSRSTDSRARRARAASYEWVCSRRLRSDS